MHAVFVQHETHSNPTYSMFNASITMSASSIHRILEKYDLVRVGRKLKLHGITHYHRHRALQRHTPNNTLVQQLVNKISPDLLHSKHTNGESYIVRVPSKLSKSSYVSDVCTVIDYNKRSDIAFVRRYGNLINTNSMNIFAIHREYIDNSTRDYRAGYTFDRMSPHIPFMSSSDYHTIRSYTGRCKITQADLRNAYYDINKCVRFDVLSFKRSVGAYAVVRNRARKKINSAARSVLAEYCSAQWDIIAVAHSTAAITSHKQLQNEIIYALNKLGAIRADKQNQSFVTNNQTTTQSMYTALNNLQQSERRDNTPNTDYLTQLLKVNCEPTESTDDSRAHRYAQSILSLSINRADVTSNVLHQLETICCVVMSNELTQSQLLDSSVSKVERRSKVHTLLSIQPLNIIVKRLIKHLYHKDDQNLLPQVTAHYKMLCNQYD